MRLRWTRLAVRDFTQICGHSDASFGHSRGHRTALDIYDAVKLLAEFPQAGRLGRVQGTYELVIAGLPFVAVYRIKNDAIELLRILHGAQKWP